MNDQARQDMIEKAARAIHAVHTPTTGYKPSSWDDDHEAWQETYRDFARAALAVFEEAANVTEPPITDISVDQMSFESVTRITVAGPEGIVFERYDLYPDGVELLVQDEGRTLKVLPRVSVEGGDEQ